MKKQLCFFLTGNINQAPRLFIKSVLLSLIIMVLFIGCGDKNDNITNPEPVGYDTLIPLKLGNYWLYDGYLLHDDGTIHDQLFGKSGFVIDDSLTRTIEGKNILCYKMFNCGEELKPYYDEPGSFEGSKLIYQNTKGTYYAGIEKNDTIKAAFNDLMFPNIAKIGDSLSGHVFYYTTSWNPSNVPNEATTNYICISTDSLFTTPLGDFHCIVYKMAYYDLEPLFRSEIFYFIKPGIGIVGMINTVYHYNLDKYRYSMRFSLIDYKIN
ncbi:MAG: hypothetical protein KKB34_04170 [Bacteroidetes bacterium]|nr:hypothetical protein [Bacteroidota bacterium]